jgi:hypothetical protein
MRSIRTHIRTSIVGYVALFFALSAGAYAAGLAPDTVKSKHIKDNQVKTADVRDDNLAGGGLTGDDIVESSLTGVPVGANTVGSGQVIDDSLGAADLGPDSVQSSELATDAVGSGQVIDDSLGAVDLGPDSVGSSEIATNGVGKPEINSNTIGSEELLAINEVVNSQPVPVGEKLTVTATCPAGQQILTGGFATDEGFAYGGYSIEFSRRSPGGWQVRAYNQFASAGDLTAYAYCLTA